MITRSLRNKNIVSQSLTQIIFLTCNLDQQWAAKGPLLHYINHDVRENADVPQISKHFRIFITYLLNLNFLTRINNRKAF